ncbi:patatin-like phospholipase family protein [candidate division WOR-3 bacterium]|nr:patatin-like phospholipase family protein [candidate division WOR-3 bacterium]
MISFVQDSSFSSVRVGLVLSGGGARGFAHIGVLQVLERAGFRFDCISGTSMGSIVGGLYASGYTPCELEEMATEVNWGEVFDDGVKRRDLPLDERLNSERYIGGLDFEGFKPILPMGLIEGQRIEELLSYLTWRTSTVEDFSKLPTPFICVAADVEKSEAVVLSEGSLYESMRASMSIPTIFTPVVLDRRLLVDGGTIRNFPVQDVKKLGADFVIGVDVGTPTKKYSEFHSAVDIINQVIGFSNTRENLEQRAMCDFLITPELENFSSYDFSNPDTFIKLGEISAEKCFETLVFLADSLNMSARENQRFTQYTPDSVFVKDIYVIGLKEVSRTFVVSSFGFDCPCWLDDDKIREGVEDVYNTLFFKKVNYRLKEADDAYILIIIVEENRGDRINLGLRYNSYTNTQLLLNITLRNYLLRNSKFTADLKLGENYSFGIKYYLYASLGYVRNKIGIVLGAGLDQKYFYLYEGGSRFARLDFKSVYGSATFGLTLLNNVNFTFGAKLDYSALKPDVAPVNFRDSEYNGVVYTARLESDNLDRIYFTGSGIKTILEVTVGDKNFGSKDNYLKLTGDMSVFVPVTDKTALFFGAWGGISEAESLSVQNRFYMGGHTPTDCMNTFLGYENMELSGRQMAAFRTGLRIEPLENRYLEFQFNGGKIAGEIDELLENENIHYGAGLTLGSETPIGPLYISAAGRNVENINFYLNIGYNF